MRVICESLFFAMVVVIGIFCIENPQQVQIGFLGNSSKVALPLIVAAVYVLGMTTGTGVWSILKNAFKPKPTAGV